MAQTIYDRPDFFAAYSRLPRSVGGLDEAAEWPSMRALLSPMEGLRVVDLGCGFGWFCRFAREAGATRVLGFDVSERMLERARSSTADAAITYERADLSALDLPAGAFDLAYSSLALHYLEDVRRFFAAVHRALVPGGAFVFSTEHPILMAPRHAGWITHPAGHAAWPLEGYLDEGPRTTDWLAPGVVKHHRTIATTLNGLLGAGFALSHVEEFGPSPAQIGAHPDWARERERPMFLLVGARREA